MLLPTIESVKSFAAIGATVQVHSFGCWFDGTVVKFGKKNVTVTFTTSGGPRTKTFQPGYVVRPGTYITARRGQPEPFYEKRCRTNLFMLSYGIAKARRLDAAGDTSAPRIDLPRAIEHALASGCEQHEIDAAVSETAVLKAMELL